MILLQNTRRFWNGKIFNFWAQKAKSEPCQINYRAFTSKSTFFFPLSFERQGVRMEKSM